MARLPHDATAGHTDSSAHSHATVLDASSGHNLTLPGNQYVSDAEILRDGQNLVLHPAHGQDVVVQNYFSADPAPLLSSADGATLTPDLVESFVKPMGGIQFAQNGSVDDTSPVGTIKETSGEATVTHADGTVQKAAIGTPIFEGDIIETKEHGAVNITFVDKTTFAVSENAKMAIDQYVFDPSTQHGENSFSILRGVFVFTSGLIGHADPDDVKIHTPVGSIGIRGTTIMGTINPGHDSHISVVEGAIVVSNGTGEQTLSQQFETVKLTGMNQAMHSEGVLPADQMASNYNVLRTVSAPLFSTFDDMGKSNNQPTQDQAPAGQPHDAPTPADAAPVNKSDAGQPAGSAEQKTAAAELAPPAPAQTDLNSNKASLDSSFDANANVKTTAPAFASDTSTTIVNSLSARSAGSPSATQSQTATGAAGTINNLASTLAANSATSTSGALVNSTTNPAGTANATNSASNAGTVINLSPFALSFSNFNITSAALAAGVVIGTVTTTSGYTNISYKVDTAHSAWLTVQQDASGIGRIVLTTLGATHYIGATHIDFGITAVLSDGRTAAGTNDVIITHVTAPPAYDLLLNDAIHGAAAGTSYIATGSPGNNVQQGANIAALGDFNHDGNNDFIMTDNRPTHTFFMIQNGSGNLLVQDLTGTAYNFNKTASISVSSAGDFNGDGKGDIIIGSYSADDAGHFSSGKIEILSGASPVFQTAPITITGFADGALAGMSVSGAGDFNGDGYSDVLIGSPDPSGIGKAYVIYGHQGISTVDVSTLGPSSPNTYGVVINGPTSSLFGTNVSFIGDYNDDGFSDIAVTAPNLGTVSIYYGQNSTSSAPSSITYTGFSTSNTANLPSSSLQVIALGNNDDNAATDFGVLDRVANKFYVFDGSFGHGSGTFNFTASGDVAYTISGPAGSSMLAAGNAGDFNGDGINDVMVALRNGSNVDIYVVYGATYGGTLNPASMADSNIFHMSLNLATPQFNLLNPSTDAISITLSGAGDQNGDGYDDIVIGLPNLDSVGSGTHSNDGGAIIVNGRAEPGTITTGLSATANFQSLVGTTGSDVMTNGGFTDTSFHLGASNDTLNILGSGDSEHTLDGGTGIDTLNFLSLGANIDLRETNISNFENINMAATGTQILHIGIDQIFDLLHQSQNNALHIGAAVVGSHTLAIDNNATSSTTLTQAGFTDGGIVGGEHAWTQGSYTLYIDTSVAVTVT